MTKHRLPALAFGERGARPLDRPWDAVAQSITTMSSLRKYEAKGKDTEFSGKVANIHLRDLALHANSSEPVRAEMAPAKGLFFIMTLQGVCRTEIESRKYEVVPNHKALLLTERSVRYGESDTRSVFVARLDAIRLRATARAMLGESGRAEPRLDQSPARAIELRFGALDHTASMRSLFGLIDANLDRPAILDTLGADDVFYRQLALMTWPNLFLNADDAPVDRLVPSLDELCEIIRSRLDRPLTMTEMERITRLSGRTLQYAFKKRFGCSPMEWQKRERLNLAHIELSTGETPVNIAALAAQFGFSSPSRFAQYYKKLFGVSPSARKR